MLWLCLEKFKCFVGLFMDGSRQRVMQDKNPAWKRARLGATEWWAAQKVDEHRATLAISCWQVRCPVLYAAGNNKKESVRQGVTKAF
jgi:hypothetical protein